MLKRRGLKHEVLNAKYHQREAEIVSDAGKAGAITIATNMAGRGTDIKLGSNVKQCGVCGIKARLAPFGQVLEDPDLSEQEIKKRGCHSDPPCGLVVIGTERHDSRRIDRQLRGRSGRQGDPGDSVFFLSLEDDLMRLFGSDRIAKIMDRTGAEDGEVITHPLVTRAIESAQKRVEYQNFQARKRLLDYDDVMNQQREVVYSLRLFALEGGEELKAEAVRMIEDALHQYASGFEAQLPDQWDRELMAGELMMKYMIATSHLEDFDKVQDVDALGEVLTQAGHDAFQAKLASWEELSKRYNAEDLVHRLLSHVMLQVLDEKWKEHLFELDQLRSGIQYRAWGQKDPLVEYKKEAFEIFVDLMRDIKSTFTERLSKFQVQITPGGPPPQRAMQPPPQAVESHPDASESDLMVPGGRRGATASPPPLAPPPPRHMATNRDEGGARAPSQQRRMEQKVGRNDPCPCGSGKKYKKCHGMKG